VRSRPESWIVCLGALALGCAATPQPRVLTELDRVRASQPVAAARSSAPQAFARAEGLRAEAARLHDNEDPAGAQIVGEQALAAYQRAVTLARLARSEARATSAQEELAVLEAELARTLAAEQTLEADTRALELRLKVARETLPQPTSGPPQSPERELARRDAARALGAQARLLCSAARLLEPKRASLDAAFQKLAEFEASLPTAPMAPIDDARALRTTCLRELSATRRARTQQNPASLAADRLLSELSNASLLPSRDDRGVVITVHKPFERDDSLTADALKKLTELASVAKTHPDFPLLVVVHSAVKLPEARELARVERASSALKNQGVPSVGAAGVGNALPGLDPRKPGAAARNERLEVVFVAPTTS
jgi:hypothetical protein